jgi:hypothetical protein
MTSVSLYYRNIFNCDTSHDLGNTSYATFIP